MRSALHHGKIDEAVVRMGYFSKRSSKAPQLLSSIRLTIDEQSLARGGAWPFGIRLARMDTSWKQNASGRPAGGVGLFPGHAP